MPLPNSITNEQIAHVRQLHAEQEQLDTIQIGKAVKLPPYVVADIIMGHPLDDITADDLAAVAEAASQPYVETLGDISMATGLPVGTVNAIQNGLYNHLLRPGWDLV